MVSLAPCVMSDCAHILPTYNCYAAARRTTPTLTRRAGSTISPNAARCHSIRSYASSTAASISSPNSKKSSRPVGPALRRTPRPRRPATATSSATSPTPASPNSRRAQVGSVCASRRAPLLPPVPLPNHTLLLRRHLCTHVDLSASCVATAAGRRQSSRCVGSVGVDHTCSLS